MVARDGVDGEFQYFFIRTGAGFVFRKEFVFDFRNHILWCSSSVK